MKWQSSFWWPSCQTLIKVIWKEGTMASAEIALCGVWRFGWATIIGCVWIQMLMKHWHNGKAGVWAKWYITVTEKSEMLKKEIRKENETQSENFIYPSASLQKHHTLVTLKDNGRGEWCHLSYSQKKIFSVAWPPTFKSCTDIEQFVKQLLHRNYPNHTQSVERAVKMTTTASGRIAGSKRQIGEALRAIAGRKKQWIGKKILRHKKSCSG